MSEKIFTEQQLKKFVIKLRKKHRVIEDKQIFCSQHNFKIESEVKRIEAELVRVIILEMEHEFNLGFVWDNSLD